MKDDSPVKDNNSKGRFITGLVYFIYLAGLPMLAPWIVGATLAYFTRSRSAPVWANHATYQIRSFWLLIANGLFAFLTLTWAQIRMDQASSVETAILSWIPLILLAGYIIWLGGRSLKGLILVLRNRPHANPMTLGW